MYFPNLLILMRVKTTINHPFGNGWKTPNYGDLGDGADDIVLPTLILLSLWYTLLDQYYDHYFFFPIIETI